MGYVYRLPNYLLSSGCGRLVVSYTIYEVGGLRIWLRRMSLLLLFLSGGSHRDFERDWEFMFWESD